MPAATEATMMKVAACAQLNQKERFGMDVFSETGDKTNQAKQLFRRNSAGPWSWKPLSSPLS
jgi:hypothetical protein